MELTHKAIHLGEIKNQNMDLNDFDRIIKQRLKFVTVGKFGKFPECDTIKTYLYKNNEFVRHVANAREEIVDGELIFNIDDKQMMYFCFDNDRHPTIFDIPEFSVEIIKHNDTVDQLPSWSLYLYRVGSK